MKTNLILWPSVVLNAGLLLIIVWLDHTERPYSEITFTPASERASASISTKETPQFPEESPAQPNSVTTSEPLYQVTSNPPSERAALLQQHPTQPHVAIATQREPLRLPATSHTNVATSNGRTIAATAVKPGNTQTPVHAFTQQNNNQRVESDSFTPAALPQAKFAFKNAPVLPSEPEAEAVADALQKKSTVDPQPIRPVESLTTEKPTPQAVAEKPGNTTEGSFAHAPRSRLSQYMRDTGDTKTMLFTVEQQQLRANIGWQNFYYEQDTAP